MGALQPASVLRTRTKLGAPIGDHRQSDTGCGITGLDNSAHHGRIDFVSALIAVFRSISNGLIDKGRRSRERYGHLAGWGVLKAQNQVRGDDIFSTGDPLNALD